MENKNARHGPGETVENKVDSTTKGPDLDRLEIRARSAYRRHRDNPERLRAELQVLTTAYKVSPAVMEAFKRQFEQELLDTSKPVEPPLETEEPQAELKKEEPFRVFEWQKDYKNGVYFFSDGEPHWICDPLHITAKACDETGNSWGRLLEFSDPAGNKHQWAMPMRILAGDCTELRERLLDAGLSIAPGRKARELLTQYIQTAKPKEFARCVERTGWHRGAFVFPDEIIGPPSAERVLLQTSGPPTAIYNPAGTLEEWQREVAALCVDNSRLVFAVSTGFAAFLLEITGDENGGFHYRGQSSIGKTIVLAVAASIFGCKDYLQRWRATVNGLEAIAATHNDALLILDEIGQVDAKEAGDVAYMLANGKGKHRANRHGGARPAATWRLLFFSSGEISLADHMQAVGKKAHAGQETRLVDIPADTGRFGVFENLHGCSVGADFALKLAAATRTFYGTAARKFLQKLTATDLETSRRAIEELIKDFIAEHILADASGQVQRVARRFALVAAGGELATAFGITGWPAGEAIKAAVACFQAWLHARGGVGPQEERKALEQVRLFFEQHGESRFTPWICEKCGGTGEVTLANGDEVECLACVSSGNPNRPTINRAGFRRNTDNGQEFYVFPEVFKAEICKGLDRTLVARLLIERGLVYPDKDGKKAVTVHKPPGCKAMRLYHFTPAILGGVDSEN